MFTSFSIKPRIGRQVRGSPSTVASFRKRNGVTMVESMIVMVVLGTMFSFALPRMNDGVRQRRVIAAANALNADMPVAFSLAARQRKPVIVSYDAASGEVRVSDRATDMVYVRRALRSTSEYMLDNVTISPASIQIFPNGVSSSAFTVRLENGKYVRQLFVGRTGFTRVTAN
jgi:prepilin-type N-terminal cleavage/methylation domain-containing protein